MTSATIYSQTLLDHARILALPTIRRILAKRRNAASKANYALLAELTTDLLRATRAAIGLKVPHGSLRYASPLETDVSTMTAVLTRVAFDNAEARGN